MANAYKCDRCGVFFEEYKGMNNYPLVANGWVHGSYRFYHLCEKCHEDLKLFMEDAPVLKNEH